MIKSQIENNNICIYSKKKKRKKKGSEKANYMIVEFLNVCMVVIKQLGVIFFLIQMYPQ